MSFQLSSECSGSVVWSRIGLTDSVRLQSIDRVGWWVVPERVEYQFYGWPNEPDMIHGNIQQSL